MLNAPPRNRVRILLRDRIVEAPEGRSGVGDARNARHEAGRAILLAGRQIVLQEARGCEQYLYVTEIHVPHRLAFSGRRQPEGERCGFLASGQQVMSDAANTCSRPQFCEKLRRFGLRCHALPAFSYGAPRLRHQQQGHLATTSVVSPQCPDFATQRFGAQPGTLRCHRAWLSIRQSDD